MAYIPPNPNGQTTKANSSPITLASDQNNALETGGNLAAIKTDVDKIPSQGQALSAASMPVVLPAAQITTLTPLATITTTQGTPASLSAGWPVIGGELADTTGTFTNATQTTSVTSSSFDGYSTVIVSMNGTYGTATGVFEISDDSGTTWYSVNAARTDGTAIETGYTSLTNTNRMWTLSVSGADQFRVRSTAVASGTANVRLSVESMPTPEAASVSAYQSTAANLNATIVGTGTFAAQATLQTQTDTVMVGGVNIKEINAVTPLMGNGVTGTGSQRVTIASDNTAISVNATLSAETTKVIGTVIANAGTNLNTSALALESGGNLANISAAYATIGAAAPANAVYLSGRNSAGNVSAVMLAANAINSSGNSYIGASLIAQFDDVSPTSITENNFGNLRMSANRNLYGTIRDAAGNERGANVNASNQLLVASSDAPVVGTALNTYSIHLTTNATTTPTASTAYISSISISSEVAGTTSTVTIQDKSGTPLKLVSGFSTTTLTTTPTVVNFQTPVKMTSGIDIVTAGAVAATIDVWVNYYQ